MQGGETEALGELQALPAVAPAIVSVNAHTHVRALLQRHIWAPALPPLLCT